MRELLVEFILGLGVSANQALVEHIHCLINGIAVTLPEKAIRMDDLGRGEKWNAFVKSMIPLGYLGDGSECAEIVLFLVTDRGKWITGQAPNVDGGTVWGN